ncbi:hypothetical protein K435DRAFT_871773 [Dendrothele bispora CBS 962.96]|uniref:Uncharacterized protein n=1 Tax=Dendrothele bispora (strain CBS 962.96) TaxID=1314807 RepID=A0A4S8L3X3_DENBC|nr:hypothetical protein K435DRAFT_871773 [Dendrothele bispora CBS 962.96]
MTHRQVQGQYTIFKDLPPLPTPRTDPHDSSEMKSSAKTTQAQSRPSSQMSRERSSSETLHSISSSSTRQNGTFIRSRISCNESSHTRTSRKSIQSSVNFPSQAPDEHSPPEISEIAKRRIRSDSDAQSVFSKSFKSNRTATSNSSAKSGCSGVSLLRVVRKSRETQSTIDEDDEELDEATREARVVTRLVGKRWRYESQG